MAHALDTMPRIPRQVPALLHEVTTTLPIILGRNLVGIYVYGSLTQRSFDPERSDIDCLVVTRRVLTPVQFKRLRTWLTSIAQSNR